MSERSPGGQSIELVFKADDVLELLRTRGEQTVAELVTALGEPRSSVVRLLATLEDMGFVEQSQGSNRYQLGLRLFTLGKVVASRLGIVSALRPAMEQLAERTGETALLVIRQGAAAICVERIEGARVQSMVVNVGDVAALHAGAASLVLLAWSEPAAIDEALAGEAADAAGIRARLEQIREHGYVVDEEEPVMGMAAVAAPVRDGSGAVVAALALSGTRASLLEEGAEAIGVLVRDAAVAAAVP